MKKHTAAKTTSAPSATSRRLQKLLRSKWFLIISGAVVVGVLAAGLGLYVWAEGAAQTFRQQNQALLGELKGHIERTASLSQTVQESEPEKVKTLQQATSELATSLNERQPAKLPFVWLGDLLSPGYRQAKTAAISADYAKAKVILGRVVAYAAHQRSLADILAESQLSLQIKDEATAKQLASAWQTSAESITKLSAPPEVAATNTQLAERAAAIAAYAHTIAELYQKTEREGLKAAGPELANRLQAFRLIASELEHQAALLDEQLAQALSASSLAE